MRIAIRILTLMTLATMLSLVGVQVALAQEETGAPEDVSLIAAFRSIQPTSDNSDIDLVLTNHADTRRVVRFRFEGVPEGWDVQVWQRFFAYRLNELAIEPFDGNEGSNKQTPRVRITPPLDSVEGLYSFTLNVVSPDGGVVYDSAAFSVLLPERTPVEDGAVDVTTTFGFLQGPALSRFEFEIAIKNRTGADASFDLSAEPPLNWTVQFLPAFGDERLIASITPADNALQRVKVRVTPARFADAGTFAIPVTVSNEDYESVIGLQIQITGQGDLTLDTVATLFSFDAVAGETTQVDLVVGNVGTDALTNVSLIAGAPDGWVINFDTASFQSIAVADFLPLAALITPSKDAIPGDYLVSVIARSPDDLREITLRISVTQSTIWGWLGIVIVIAVLGGLGGLFVRLGRR